MNAVWTVSMSWSSTSFKSGTVCSRKLLMQPSTNGESNWQHACVQMDNTSNIYWAHMTDKSYEEIKCKQLCLFSKKMLLYCWACDFQGFKVSEGKVHTINRWGGILHHLSMAYLLSNICTKNYWNRATIVEIIIGCWVVSFFETLYIEHIPLRMNLKWSVKSFHTNIKIEEKNYTFPIITKIYGLKHHVFQLNDYSTWS